ncbi:phytoene/squalene synthase family protein [candidate division KSB1 bacterium]|nr:phytoene/squalene synthase family protein [candidate division KSB1 bacterium]NIR73436.1 phytoene/squalene synthase family protein [candidate division KSB1 bacterium]NIS28427.1 phytoene/squalene synthase family protein [candidate division KSB1 bacterium]NIT75307.1 phytoene/squalene synthase family protein [candidate division KSB1 bacterium]NIU29155.1 phytoene/squalene synthase family protein [candidate division KSB1 bacterium]
MKALFDKVSAECSKLTTRTYSTSFSLGIHFLHKKLHEPIYAIYGFVRFADEVVDTFHHYDKETLLADFRAETFRAIETGISLNPILNSFQRTVNEYHIEHELIDIFLKSMEMDLARPSHDSMSFQNYIFGSAEVVGLMCLWVFCNGDRQFYESLKGPAMRLGAAFQKVNFLRDLHYDYYDLSRTYFPGLDLENFTPEKKLAIENDIDEDFRYAVEGIKRLPKGTRFGVYVAYVYYRALLEKIKRSSGETLLQSRLRVPTHQKFKLLIYSILRYNLGLL